MKLSIGSILYLATLVTNVVTTVIPGAHDALVKNSLIGEPFLSADASVSPAEAAVICEKYGGVNKIHPNADKSRVSQTRRPPLSHLHEFVTILIDFKVLPVP